MPELEIVDTITVNGRSYNLARASDITETAGNLNRNPQTQPIIDAVNAAEERLGRQMNGGRPIDLVIVSGFSGTGIGPIQEDATPGYPRGQRPAAPRTP